MTTLRLVRHVLLAGALALGSAFADSAHAQPEREIQRARTLYEQGIEREAAGDWAGALATFVKVGRIKMTPQVRFHIARCKEKLGRLNEALGGYRLAEHEAKAAGRAGEDVLREIERAREALEKRVPEVVVERGEGVDSAKIELDSVVLGHAKIGRPVTVDPGPHSIRVTLIDGRWFKRTIHVKEGESLQVILDVPPDVQPASEVDHEPAAGATPSAPSVAPGPARADRAPPDAEGSSSSAWPWVATGVGAASLLSAGGFYMVAKNAEKELDEECLSDICPDTLEDTQIRGERFSLLTGAALGVGVIGVAVGVTMLLAQGESGEQVGVNVRGDSRFAGVDVVGRF